MGNSREWRRLTQDQVAAIQKHQRDGNVPVGEIARELGVRVVVSNLPTAISGQISRDQDGSYIIKINRFEAKERQRFTVAHELAHFLLHKGLIDATPEGITDNVLYRSGQPETVEFEANRLAADILMPAPRVESKLREFGGRVTEAAIDALAEYFRVSKAAMEIRLGAMPT